MTPPQLPFAVSMGDAAGVGPEVVARLFLARPGVPAFVVGDLGAMRRAAALVGGGLTVEAVEGPAFARPGVVPVLAVSALPEDLAMGRVDARAGRAAFDAVVAGAVLARDGLARALVTAPINKEALALAGVRHPGHTEILAEVAGGAEVAMMLVNDCLRVVLASIHVSLALAVARVSRAATLRAARFADQGARRFGVAAPRVAVAGLNPHAGEGGLFGREEIDLIAPAVADARAEGIDASGPHPPDTVFMRARNGEFDVVVAQYHDQGLIPIKLLGLDEGVNVTLGLPFVRTSPDHGTAFAIAGRGVADPGSLLAALRAAEAMTGARPGPSPPSDGAR